MTAVDLDTELARATGSALIRNGDWADERALDLRILCDELAISGPALSARLSIEQAASEMWEAGSFLHLIADRADAADHLDADLVADVAALAHGRVGRHGWLGVVRTWMVASGPDGDLGGTYDRELRSPYAIFGADDVERARALVLRTLADTADHRQIRSDEFEIVDVGDGHFIVVLPGVTDLSDLDLFLGDTRSVRDLDQYAIPSWRSSSVADNRYAEMVWDGLSAAGVPPGSSLMLVGHSYGADTALDLAADPGFNGADGFDVTHVVAAGYYSQPQLGDVPGSTEVLVVQNHRDAAVIAEGVGQSNGAKTIAAGVRQLDRLAHLDLPGAAAAGWDVMTGQVATVVDVGSYAVSHADDFADIAVGVGTGDFAQVGAAASDLVTLEPRLEHVDGHIVVDVFEGGADGAGHHPSNYIDYLAATDAALVTGFLNSVSAAGYARNGTAIAVDVSVPR